MEVKGNVAASARGETYTLHGPVLLDILPVCHELTCFPVVWSVT